MLVVLVLVVVLVVVELVKVVLVVVDDVVLVGVLVIGATDLDGAVSSVDAAASAASVEGVPSAHAAVPSTARPNNATAATVFAVQVRGCTCRRYPRVRGAARAPGNVSTVRLLIGLVATFGLATVAAACGQDASESAGDRGSGAYRANCAACHGGDLEGTSRGPSLLDPVYDDLTNADIRNAIRNGVEQQRFEFGPMPANAVLRDAQVTEIVAFIRERAAPHTSTD